MAAKYTPLWIILISTLAVVVALALLHRYGLDQKIIQLLQWLDSLGWQASLLFILVIAIAVVVLAPGVIFTMGAGFVFGVLRGTLYVVIGTTLGATMAFLIARYLFGPRPSRWVMSHVKPANIGEVIQREGWRMVMLTRLVPLFPFKLSNYFFGLTPLRLKDFVLGNLIGIIPITLNNVYVGSIASDLTSLASGEMERTPLQWAFYGVGFALAVVAVIGLTRMARRALAHKMDSEDL